MFVGNGRDEGAARLQAEPGQSFNKGAGILHESPIDDTMSDTSSVSATSIRLPDYPTQWPVRARNPHATEELIDETRAWLKTFSAYDDNGINRFFKCKFEEVAALAYPTLDKAGLRAAIEFMYMVFVIDEHTDEKDAESVKRQCEDIVKIMEYVISSPWTYVQTEIFVPETLTIPLWSLASWGR